MFCRGADTVYVLVGVARCVEQFFAYRAAEAEPVPDEALGFDVVVRVHNVVAGCAEAEERHFVCALGTVYAHWQVVLRKRVLVPKGPVALAARRALEVPYAVSVSTKNICRY